MRTLPTTAGGWSQSWWADDYTWIGLSKHPWAGWSVDKHDQVVETQTGRLFANEAATSHAVVRTASLQDYWRLDPNTARLRSDDELADDLIVKDGQRVFHRIHLPFHYADGTPTTKEAWASDILDHILAPRLQMGRPTAGAFRFKYGRSGWYPLGADQRTQLVGAVLLRAPPFTDQVAHLNARRASFRDDAIFDAVTLAPGSEFAGVCFKGKARFHRAIFQGDVRFTAATFCGAADFEGAVFAGEASFFQTRFLNDASFRSGRFENTVWFTAAVLENIEFRGREFLGLAYFDGAQFHQQFDFVCANFAKLASFEGIKWPPSSRDWHAAFDHAIFKSPVSFRGSGFRSLAAFSGAIFERGLQIDDLDEERAKEVFRHELSTVGPAAAEDAQDEGEIQTRRAYLEGVDITSANFLAHTEGQARWIDLATLREATPTAPLPAPSIDELETRRRNSRELRLKELEAGCRTLKHAMAVAADTRREQLLYRFELIARRKQQATSLSEKALSVTYGLVSDYGSSIFGPAFTWMCSFLVFAGAFFCWVLALPDSLATWQTQLAQAFTLSWRNASRPFSVFSQGEHDHIVSAIFKAGAWQAFALEVASSIESVASVALIFMLALAIRRRFQMT